jgi:hypothetical protein
MRRSIEPTQGRRLSRLLVFVAMGTSVVAGCQPAPGEVSGTITLKGKAPNLKGLQISFLAADGRMCGAPIGADGMYTATGVPAGEAKICFVYVDEKVPVKEGRAPVIKPPSSAKPHGSETKNPIPDALRDASTSKLAINVASGEKTVFDYDIKP